MGTRIALLTTLPVSGDFFSSYSVYICDKKWGIKATGYDDDDREDFILWLGPVER